MSNDYHKIKEENLVNYHENMKENEKQKL